MPTASSMTGVSSPLQALESFLLISGKVLYIPSTAVALCSTRVTGKEGRFFSLILLYSCANDDWKARNGLFLI